ncbi:MAG: N-acetyltransferase [Paenibacillus sp.]|nr:N-acetyltransferase [Paenibacillus sp.]
MSQETKTYADQTAIMRLRPAAPDDSERLYAFYESVQEATRAIFGSYRFTREHAAEVAGKDGVDASRRYYVAAVRETENAEETIRGLFWFWGWTKKVPWFGVMIADAYQNRGLGKKMMEYAIEETRNCNKSGILLTTAEHNVRAQSLYKRYGFETIGRDRNGEWLMMLNFPDEAIRTGGSEQADE